MQKILLLEDDPNINKRIKTALSREGYSIDGHMNGLDVFDAALSDLYDLVLLDIMTPGMDGFEVFTSLREHGINIPVLFISANQSQEYIVKAYKDGALDYIKKPFFMEELVHKVNIISGRVMTQQHQVGEEHSFDMQTKNFYHKDQLIKLTKKEKALLELLLHNRGNIVTYERIFDFVWNDLDTSMDSLRFLIKNLRKKLPQEHLVSHYSIGYELR
jgi:DNA-binding response OmpR family regulator